MGIYDDTIYIYTTYLDNLYNLDAKFLKINKRLQA